MSNTLEGILSALVREEPTVLPTGCWIWTGRRCKAGYGQVSLGRKLTMVHRAVYEHFIGPIPEGLELDHLCRHRLCARPEHLEPVTHAENCRRAQQHLIPATHCRNGHPLDGANLAWQKNPRGGLIRQCVTCRAASIHAYQSRKRGSEPKPPPSQRAHCPKGHPYSGANLRQRAAGGRSCRQCESDQAKARRLANGAPGYPKGERHPMAKLTEDRVREIRRQAAAGVLQRDLCRRFFMSPGAICEIISRKAWKHVED